MTVSVSVPFLIAVHVEDGRLAFLQDTRFADVNRVAFAAQSGSQDHVLSLILAFLFDRRDILQTVTWHHHVTRANLHFEQFRERAF